MQLPLFCTHTTQLVCNGSPDGTDDSRGTVDTRMNSSSYNVLSHECPLHLGLQCCTGLTIVRVIAYIYIYVCAYVRIQKYTCTCSCRYIQFYSTQAARAKLDNLRTYHSATSGHLLPEELFLCVTTYCPRRTDSSEVLSLCRARHGQHIRVQTCVLCPNLLWDANG